MDAARLLRKRAWGIAGAVIILLVILMAALAPLVTPYGYNEVSISERLMAPGGNHLLGTDNLGRDVFTRLLYGARPYVWMGVVATGIALVLGAILGVLSGRMSGKTDSVMRNAVMVPALLMAVFALLFEVANMPYIWWLQRTQSGVLLLSSKQARRNRLLTTPSRRDFPAGQSR